MNGITVIAGENNTGKSTIGKMLFCVFHSFYRIEEQVKEERTKSIARVLSNFYHEAANRLTRSFDTINFAREIVSQREEFLLDTRLLVKEIEEFYVSHDKYFQRYLEQDALEELAERIYKFLILEDNEIRKVILRKRLEAEFVMNVAHLNKVEERTTVTLNIKNGSIDFEIIKNKDIVINS